MSNFQTKAKRPDGVAFEEGECEFKKVMSKETIEKATDEANKEQKKIMDKK